MRRAAEGREWARRHAPLTAEQEASARVEIGRVRRSADHERGVAKAMQERVDELEAALRVALDLDRPLPAAPVVARRTAGPRKEACPVLVASDWHVEERVDPATVNGLNEYSPDIARKRARRFTEGCLWLLETHRAGATVHEAVLAVLGDMISGWIHEELRSETALRPTEAVLLAQELLHECIVTILARARLRLLRVVCKSGNHARTTDKVYHAAGQRMTYEWLMYRALASAFKKDRRVQVVVEDGYHTYLPVYDTILRLHHGNSFNFAGGVGGIVIPLKKAIHEWNVGRHADFDILGHWHGYEPSTRFLMNGSLIGHSAFAIRHRFPYQPPRQGFVLVRPGRGVSALAPVFVT